VAAGHAGLPAPPHSKRNRLVAERVVEVLDHLAAVAWEWLRATARRRDVDAPARAADAGPGSDRFADNTMLGGQY